MGTDTGIDNTNYKAEWSTKELLRFVLVYVQTFVYVHVPCFCLLFFSLVSVLFRFLETLSQVEKVQVAN